MKSLKLLVVAAVLSVCFTSCVAESLNEDQQQVEEVDVISGTGSEVDVPAGDPDEN